MPSPEQPVPPAPASIPVVHNPACRRFESQIAAAPLAFLSYRHEGESVWLEHTFVPDELRGRGVAAALVRAALIESRQQRWRVIPSCSYVAAYIDRNPEFADLLKRS